MGKARDLARLSPNTSGLLPNANIEAVAASKLTGVLPDANAPSGSIIKVTQAYSSTTRQVFGNNQANNVAGQNFVFASGAAIPVNFTKDLDNSKIIICFTMSVGGSFQQHVGMLWNASAGIYRRFGYDGSRNGTAGGDSSDVVTGSYMFDGLSAGSQSFNWALGRSQDGNDTGYKLNLSNTDAGDKSNSSSSEIIVFEVTA